MTDITRSAPLADIDRTGRTLEGLAFRWDHPSQVADRRGPSYLEEFARTAVDRTLGIQPVHPLGILHPWSPGARTSPIPVGSVRFSKGSEGLMFRAIVSKTVAGDEALELVDDFALRDVSIGARPIRNSTRMTPKGRVVRREEMALRELSLVPPGMGLHDAAQVLAVRSEQPDRVLLAEYRARALAL